MPLVKNPGVGWLHSNQEKCFWLCVDASTEHGLHMMQRTSRDPTHLQRSGVIWANECDIANIGSTEYSPGLEIEI